MWRGVCERNGSWVSSYLFNAKELDEETGLYYYGARYLDPTGAMWLSVDPMWINHPDKTPYNYCFNNPVKLVDPDGKTAVKVFLTAFRLIRKAYKYIKRLENYLLLI
ncbi:MAG: RHS repeat-associated core domain-containing protein [Paludibacteraceae bacterium]|nr:RHS repeat-associated core domain-containing protein [Paludibacteraceae bacterium]